MLLLTLSACRQIEPEMPLPSVPDTDSTIVSGDGYYVQLRFRLQSERQASAPGRRIGDHPYGGENGDGREEGINNENTIYDATFFVFNGGSRLTPDDTEYGINAAGTTPILLSQYIGHGLIVDNTASIRIPRIPISTTTQVVVVVNMGDLTTAPITTLGELRDYIGFASMANHVDPELCDRFVMTEAAPSTMTNISGGITPDNPIVFNCDVQRMAARIDWCWYPHSSIDAEGHLVIPAKNREDNTIADVTITNVRIFNRMQQIPYLLKRVTLPNSGTASFSYLAREQVNAELLPTNYVLEPTFNDKNLIISQNPNHAKLAEWYGISRFGQLDENVSLHPEQINLNERVIRSLRFDAASTNLNGIILGYTNENTMPASYYHNAYCTGLLFEAIYTPRMVIRHNSEGEWIPDETYTAGATFWCYKAIDFADGKLQYYCFASAAEALYFQSKHETLMTGEITRYQDARCYYAYWLQHAGATGNTELYPMKYGIVRNNIYRVAIRTIAGPGATTPETTVTNENIEPYIYVKPWNIRVLDEIIM